MAATRAVSTGAGSEPLGATKVLAGLPLQYRCLFPFFISELDEKIYGETLYLGVKNILFEFVLLQTNPLKYILSICRSVNLLIDHDRSI